ncbi:MAG: BF3164 family lipoprotein [Marinilabiliaceae bacterium]|jgi:hypothetical protein|nr:BF3164 family lipoprotein [Marinilabiliaceae bacterium]
MFAKRIIIISVLLIIFIGCSDEQKKHKDIIVDEFPVTTELTGYPANTIEAYSKGHVFISVVDSFLILLKSHISSADERFISIYSTNSHKLLAKTVTKGRAPGEFLDPVFTGQIEYDPDNNHPIVYIYDSGRNRLTFLDIIETVNDYKHINEQILIPQIGYSVNSLFYYSDSILVATFFPRPESQDGRFLIYNNRTKETKVIPHLPDLGLSFDDAHRFMIYYSFCSVNIEEQYIAASAIQMGEVHYFDLNGNYIKSTIFSPREELIDVLQNKVATSDPYFFVNELKTKDGLLYALNLDNLEDDLFQTKKYKDISLLVFDSDGNPIKKYIFADNRYVSHFAIDELHNRIYTFCANEAEHNIIVYDF